MGSLLDLYRSLLIKKVVMALSGLILFGFVLMHMVGNLKIYGGAEKLNSYAEGLRGLGAPVLGHGEALWIARAVLLVAVLLHIWSAWQLTLANRRARPQGYIAMTYQKSTYASRTMRWGGVILLFFVIYHLLHLTTGHAHPDFVAGDVYRNVVVGFSNPLTSGFYIVAQICLGFHLYHGLWSLFQSLGWSGARFDVLRQRFAGAFALLVTLGNLSFPVAVLTGFVH
jgi:succinate dehydrogenase / fumarate reductase, cytochrome b subunit